MTDQQAYNIGYTIGMALGYFIVIGLTIGLYIYTKKKKAVHNK